MTFPKPLTQSRADTGLAYKSPSSRWGLSVPAGACAACPSVSPLRGWAGLQGAPGLWVGRHWPRREQVSELQVPAVPSAQAASEGRALSYRGPGSEGDSRGFLGYPCPYLGPFLVYPSVCGRAAKHPGAPSSSPVHCTGTTARGPCTPSQEGLAPSAPRAEASGVGLSALWQKKRAMF